MKNSRKTGNIGEDFAAKMLEEKGIRILCRNFKGKNGEIDIIAEKGRYILFIEVKLRNISSEKPANAVNIQKMQRIIMTADEFMHEYCDNNYISSLIPDFCVFEVYTDNNEIVGNAFLENVYE